MFYPCLSKTLFYLLNLGRRKNVSTWLFFFDWDIKHKKKKDPDQRIWIYSVSREDIRVQRDNQLKDIDLLK